MKGMCRAHCLGWIRVHEGFGGINAFQSLCNTWRELYIPAMRFSAFEVSLYTLSAIQAQTKPTFSSTSWVHSAQCPDLMLKCDILTRNRFTSLITCVLIANCRDKAPIEVRAHKSGECPGYCAFLLFKASGSGSGTIRAWADPSTAARKRGPLWICRMKMYSLASASSNI